MNSIPEEFDDTSVVFRKVEDKVGDDDHWAAMDLPIAACGVDAGNGETYFCDEVSAQIMDKHLEQ